jgi:hypothetical protein
MDGAHRHGYALQRHSSSWPRCSDGTAADDPGRIEC